MVIVRIILDRLSASLVIELRQQALKTDVVNMLYVFNFQV